MHCILSAILHIFFLSYEFFYWFCFVILESKAERETRRILDLLKKDTKGDLKMNVSVFVVLLTLNFISLFSRLS